MGSTTTAEASHLYAPELTLRENRSRYLERNGFGDGGYEDAWVTLKEVGPLKIGFPNSAARKRAIRLHDLHHVLAQYGTDWTGESEIAAYEIGGGCGAHYAAWILNALGLSYGVWLAPRAIFQGFVRGRHARTLYDGEWRESLLDEPTGPMREKLGLDRPVPSASTSDVLAFTAWVVGTNVLFAGPVLALGVALLRLVR